MSETHVDYGVVKKPQDDIPLTKEEVEEWIKCAESFWYFATNYCYVVGPKGKTLFSPRVYQEDMVNDIIDHRFVIANAPRQCGKTALMALYLLHEITFSSDTTSGITSFKLSNVKDVIQRIKYSYENLPNFLKNPVTRYNAYEIMFTNNSLVYGEVTSENALRGKTITGTAVLDEFAFVTPEVAEDFTTSFLPALEAAGEDSSTKVIIISTPNSSTGKYAEIVNGAIDNSNGWHYHRVDHTKIPGRTKDWEKQMIRKIGPNKFKQEFQGHFLSDNSSLINSSILESIEYKEPVREIGDLKLFIDSFRGRKIAMGVDVAEGVGKDNHCFQLVDIDSLTQVGEFTDNMMNQNQYFKKILKTIHLMYDEGVSEVYMSIEKNGLGNGLLRLYENSQDIKLSEVMMINDVNELGCSTGRSGLTTTNKTKLEGCALFKEMMEEYKMTIVSHPLLNELKMFTKQGASFKAEKGAKDDRVMAMIIVMNMLKQIANYEDNVYDVINEINMDEDDYSDIYF